LPGTQQLCEIDILWKREKLGGLCEVGVFCEKLLFAQSRKAAKIRKESPFFLSIYFESPGLSSGNFVLYKTGGLVIDS
jgi:hypothetical protein